LLLTLMEEEGRKTSENVSKLGLQFQFWLFKRGKGENFFSNVYEKRRRRKGD